MWLVQAGGMEAFFVSFRSLPLHLPVCIVCCKDMKSLRANQVHSGPYMCFRTSYCAFLTFDDLRMFGVVADARLFCCSLGGALAVNPPRLWLCAAVVTLNFVCRQSP